MAAEPQEFTLSDVTTAALDVLPSAVRTAVAHAPDASEPFGPPSASLEVQVSALQARLATALATARKAGPAPSTSRRATRGSARAGAAGSDPSSDEAEARNATEAVALLSAAHSALTDCDAALRRGRADAAVGSLAQAREAVDKLGRLTDEEEEEASPGSSSVAAALPGARRALRALREAISTRQSRVAHTAATLWDGCFAIASGSHARQLVEGVRAAGLDEDAAARGAADELDAADDDAALLDALVSGVAAVLHVQGPRLPGAGAAGVPSSPSPAWALALLGRVGMQHQAAAIAGSASSLSSALLSPALAGELGLVPVSLPVARRNRDECLIAAIAASSSSSSSLSASGHDATAAAVSRVGRTLRLVADAMGAGEQEASAEERSEAGAASARFLSAVWWGHSLDEEEFREDGDEDDGVDFEAGALGEGGSATGADRVPVGWKGLAPSRQSLEGAAEEALDAADAASALDQGSGLALALVRALSDGCPERVADAGTLRAAADSAVALEQWVLGVLRAAAVGATTSGSSSGGGGGADDDAAAEWHAPALLAAVAADLPHHAAVARRQRVLARARDICVGSGFAAAVPVGEASPAAPGTVTALVGASVAATPGDAAASASGAGGGTAADARTVRVTPDGDWEDDGWAQAWEEPSPAEQPAPHPLAVDDAAIAAARAGPTAEDEAAAAGAAGAAAAATAPDGAAGSSASLRARVQHARLHAALDLRSARVTATPFFRLAACSVSQAAADILQLVRETLLEAASLGSASEDEAGKPGTAMPAAARERAAAILFHAARDCITVYRAVVPAAFGEELARSPRAAALVHNDCLFLAHHAVTLCLRVQPSLPGALRSTATFADMVPPLRELAERCLVTQVRAQREALRAALRTPLGPAGHPLGPDAAWTSACPPKPSVDVDSCAGRGPEVLDAVLERPVQRALALVDSVAGVWAGVLPCRVFRAAIAHLLDTLLSSLAAAVLSAQFLPRPVAAGCAAALALVVDKVPLVVAADEATAAGAGAWHAASLRLSEPALRALVPQLARAIRVQELTAAVGSGGVAALESALRARPAGELVRPPTDDAGPLSRIEAARLVRAAEVSPHSGDGAARTADMALQDRRQAVEDELLA